MRPRRGFGVVGYLTIVLVVVIVGGLAGIFPFRQIIANDRAVALAEQKLDALAAENARLEQQMAALESPEEVERLAREHFGLVRPGEIGFVAVPTPEADAGLGRFSTVPDEEGRPWWRSLWDFLTGRDLIGDE
jgi:cell division protein FtsB